MSAEYLPLALLLALGSWAIYHAVRGWKMSERIDREAVLALLRGGEQDPRDAPISFTDPRVRDRIRASQRGERRPPPWWKRLLVRLRLTRAAKMVGP